MATTLMITIKVEDLAKWKAAYDAAGQMRSNMGIVVKGIYQSADDEKEVTLISEYPSMEAAKQMLANPQWEETQRRSGVIGGFEAKFFNTVQ